MPTSTTATAEAPSTGTGALAVRTIVCNRTITKKPILSSTVLCRSGDQHKRCASPQTRVAYLPAPLGLLGAGDLSPSAVHWHTCAGHDISRDDVYVCIAPELGERLCWE